MNRADYETDPCPCAECVQAGVSEKPQIRDWGTGVWMHGYALKDWYEAKERFSAALKRLAEKGTMK